MAKSDSVVPSSNLMTMVPFCPPPCCWCAPGCATCCGTCRGPRESSGLAQFYENTLLPFQMREAFFGAAPGVLPPEAMEMTRQPLNTL